MPHPFPQLDDASPASALEQDAPYSSASSDLLSTWFLSDLVSPADPDGLLGGAGDGLTASGLGVVGGSGGGGSGMESETTTTTTSTTTEFDPDSFLNVGVTDLSAMPPAMEEDDDDDDEDDEDESGCG